MRNILLITTLCLTLSGCSLFSERAPDVRYLPIPEGYLLPCELPEKPLDNALLSDAFAQAYKCGEQGNNDKQKIRDLIDE